MTDEVTGAGRRQGDDESREGWREGAPNPTQARIDSEGADDRPGDVAWGDDRWGERPDDDSGEAEIRP